MVTDFRRQMNGDYSHHVSERDQMENWPRSLNTPRRLSNGWSLARRQNDGGAREYPVHRCGRSHTRAPRPVGGLCGASLPGSHAQDSRGRRGSRISERRWRALGICPRRHLRSTGGDRSGRQPFLEPGRIKWENALLPGGYDPHERIRVMDAEGYRQDPGLSVAWSLVMAFEMEGSLAVCSSFTPVSGSAIWRRRAGGSQVC